MLKAQQAYGHDCAQSDDGIIALGRNLYTLVPEDLDDRGPLAQAAFRLVADVRLDNRKDLSRALAISPNEEGSLSDSALLFRGLLAWGENCIDRLVGDFAFAFWNGAERRLLLARDIFGQRPLHFHRGERFFAFASMPSGLHALPDVPYDFDSEFMANSLALLPHAGPGTFFRGIERVEPAHALLVTATGVQSRRYWNPRGPSSRKRSPQHYEEGLREVLGRAVEAHLRGTEGTVASHLSAGLDSSIVTSTAARLIHPGRVIAFTAVPRRGFDGPLPRRAIADETQGAAATARQYPNIEHVLVERDNDHSPLEPLDREYHYQQQPVPSLCNAVWGRQINRLVSERSIKVLLTGGAGNMSISYSGLESLPWLLRQGRLLKAGSTALALIFNGTPLLSVGSQLIGPFLPHWAWRLVGRRITALEDYTALNPRLLPQIEKAAQERSLDLAYRPRKDPFETRLWALTRVDAGNYYKGVLGEWGVDWRDPTADKRVVEYCLSVPETEFLRGGVPRSLARRAFRDRLPKEVAEARVRGYQSADWYEGFQGHLGSLRDEVERISRCEAASAPMDLDWLRKTAESWPGDDWGDDGVLLRYRYGLLRAISAGHFMRKVAGTN